MSINGYAGAARVWLPDVDRQPVASTERYPYSDDVVVRQRRSNADFVYVLGTLRTPNQYLVCSYDEAVRHAVEFARSRHVRAWFDDGDDTFRLLGSFRLETEKPVRVVSKSVDRKKKKKARSAVPVIVPEAAGGPV